MGLLGDYGGVGAGALAQGFKGAYFPMEELAMRKEESQRTAARQAMLDDITKRQMAMQEQAFQTPAQKQQAALDLFAKQQEITSQYKQPKMAAGVKEFVDVYGRKPTPQEYIGFVKSKRPVSSQYQMSIPSGFQPTFGPQGQMTGLQPIPGGPQAAKIEAAQEKTAAGKKQAEVKKGIVVEDIDRIFGIMDKANVPPVGLGSMLSFVPQTDAANIARTLETLKASVGFDTLQQMRDSSPTGGALGQVSERENVLLQSALGSLDQSLSPEMFKYNLNRVKNLYLDTIHGPGNWDQKTGKPWATMPIGTEEDGYKYIGGDPSKEESWEPK